MIEMTKPFIGALTGWIILGEDEVFKISFIIGLILTVLGI